MSGVAVWFLLRSGLASFTPPRRAHPGAQGGRGWAAAAASASRSGGAGRCGAQPGDLAPFPRGARSLPLSPAAGRRPQRGRAGHVGASVTPSLTPSHTPARTHPRAWISCSFPGRHTGAQESLAGSPQGSEPLCPAPGPALGKQLLLSEQLLRGLRRSHLWPLLLLLGRGRTKRCPVETRERY